MQMTTHLRDKTSAMNFESALTDKLQFSPIGTLFSLQEILTVVYPVAVHTWALPSILQRFQLTALNSWNAQFPPTFINEPHTSRIDHMFMRIADTDSLSKDVKLFPHAAFLPINGARHIPMVCSIRKIPYAYTKSHRSAGCSYRQRLQCRQDWIDDTPHWDQFHRAFTSCFTEFTHLDHSDSTVIDDLHTFLMPTFQSFYPSNRQHGQSHSDDSETQQLIQTKWKHRELFLSCRRTTLHDLFHAWFHIGRFQVLKESSAPLSTLENPKIP